ncbi:unnamed protein product [Schistosoma turkestanicum]|nr:unnamed protein product [Schistosoma turkestanicum]
MEVQYNEGRFPVPPKFDFRHLPLRSRKVTVISFIGEHDIFLDKSQFSYIFKYTGKEIPLSDLPRNYIEGYYDCENQIIFLVFNNLELELLFKGCDTELRTWEKFLKRFDYTLLKVLYFLFVVSHFIVVTCIGTNVNPDLIRIFKLLDKMRLLMRHPIDIYTRDLPLPRDWLNNGRASIPRLLFVFKMTPAQSKIIKDWKLVRQLEQNIVTQIFNTFYEAGLVSNVPTNQLFMLPGHNFVHVLLENEQTTNGFRQHTSCEDVAQQYFEFILKNVNHISNMSPNKIPNLFASSTFLLNDPKNSVSSVSPPSPRTFPAPDQPAQHNLSSFLHLHVECMIDQVSNKNSSFGQTTVAYELPTCKAWFMACYRIYTSLISDEHLTTLPTPEMNTGQNDSSSRIGSGGAVVSLSQSWHNELISILCPTLHTSTLSIAQKQTSQRSATQEEEEALLTSNYNNPWSTTDPINRLSIIRYRAAISTAENHYKQDLPVHYSCTYHIIKVISAYNVAIGLARGHSVFRLLEKLSSRLTHLYLAGRVTCSAVSLSGQACQHELHRVPDDLNTLKGILSTMDNKSSEDYTVPNSDENLLSHQRYQPNSSVNKLHGIDLKIKDEYIIPFGLSGKWKRYWIECAIKSFTNNNNNTGSLDQNLSNEKQTNDTLNSDNPDQHLAVMPHRSDVIMISSCGCGRQQAERLDPFDYKEANWRFYHILSNVCCNKLTNIRLSPQILSDPRHTFCLPNENPHLVTLTSSNHHQTNTKIFNEKSVCILTKPKNATSSPSPPPASSSSTTTTRTTSPPLRVSRAKTLTDNNNSIDDDDENDTNTNADIGLSQPDDNDLLLLSADSDHSNSSKVVMHRKSTDDDDDDDDDSSDNSINDKYMNAVNNLSESSSPNPSELSNISDSVVPSQNDLIDKTAETKNNECVNVSAHNSQSKINSSTNSIKVDNSSPTDLVSLYPVKFRDGVPNTNWFVGDLPLYPSWSIYALGKYFSYSHSSGLPCRGFLRNSNFLLPWDVSLMNNNSTWNSSERGRFSKSARGRYRGGRTESDTVKLFIGFEMECSMGHRFFITGTDRIMDGPMQSSQVRRAVHLLLTRDLPIFMPCQCHHPTPHVLLGSTRHSANPTNEWEVGSNTNAIKSSNYTDNPIIMAQLSRIYLAIPAAPIQVRFQPCIRPGPSKVAPIFHLGHTLDQCCDKKLDSTSDSGYDQSYSVDDDLYFYEDRTKPSINLHPDTVRSERHQSPGYVNLDNGYLWVIRLPLAYHDGTKLYPKPLYSSDCNEWKLLKGCIKLVA